MTDLLKAKAETRRYHEEYYATNKLFEPGSWLESADQALLNLLPEIEKIKSARVLDIGCGVGRNAIPVAKTIKQSGGKLLAVDLLEAAIKKLQDYALEHQVQDVIEPTLADFESFPIQTNAFHLIIAFSVLEHSSSFASLQHILDSIIEGTCKEGFNRLEFSTDRKVCYRDTGEPVLSLIETPLTSKVLLPVLSKKYANWSLRKFDEWQYEENFERDGRPVVWCSNQISLLAQRVY